MYNFTYLFTNHDKLINGWVHSLYSLVWFSNHLVLKYFPQMELKFSGMIFVLCWARW